MQHDAAAAGAVQPGGSSAAEETTAAGSGDVGGVGGRAAASRGSSEPRASGGPLTTAGTASGAASGAASGVAPGAASGAAPGTDHGSGGSASAVGSDGVDMAVVGTRTVHRPGSATTASSSDPASIVGSRPASSSALGSSTTSLPPETAFLGTASSSHSTGSNGESSSPRSDGGPREPAVAISSGLTGGSATSTGGVVALLSSGAPHETGASAGPQQPSSSTLPDQAATTARQLLQVLTPMRSGDGIHEIVLALSPEGLGTVRAELMMSGTGLSVHLVADTAEGHQALVDVLPHLEQEMAGAGRQVSVSLAHGDQHSSSPWSGKSNHRALGRSDLGDRQDREPVASLAHACRTSTIDLRL